MYVKVDMKFKSAIFAIAVATGLASVRAAMADGPPATRPAIASLKVTIVEFTGNVQVRSDSGQPWQAVKVGMEVGEGAEFRTGPRSSVRCTIPPDQSFTLDRLGTVKVLAALRDGNKLKTDMVMKYGRTKYTIEDAGLEHEGAISSPSGTLAVRGTVVSLYDQPPFVPQAVSYTGKARFRDDRRQVNLGGKGAGTQTVAANRDSAAATALWKAVIDPKFDAARTDSERELIAGEPSSGGTTSFDPAALLVTRGGDLFIPVIRGGVPIANDNTLAKTLPGKLDFVARWFGRATVNLEVFVDLRKPLDALLGIGGSLHADEFLYPGFGLNHTASGGAITSQTLGGSKGGTEIAYWKNPPKNATFGIGVVLLSNEPVDLKINAFLNGQKQYIYYTDAQGQPVRSKTLELVLTKHSLPGGPTVYIPNLDQLLGFKTPAVGDGALPPIPQGGGPGSGSNGGSGGATSGNSGAISGATSIARPKR